MRHENLRQSVRDMVNDMSPQMFADTGALFGPIAVRPDAACGVARDLPYGENIRHRLDVFAPIARGVSSPVVLFVHGGGFSGGDKGAPTDAFYNNIGAWAVREGFVAVTMTYRLAPDHRWPVGGEDVAAAVEWLRRNVGDYGGDPAAIFLLGHSAGAVHVADYLAAPCRGGAAPRISGAVLVSGVYDITRLGHDEISHAYFGTDVDRYAEQSSLAGLTATDVPLLFAVAEHDPFLFQHQAKLLLDAWFEAKGALPRMLFLPDANHISPIFGLGLDHDLLSDELAAFVGRFDTGERGRSAAEATNS